jgi:hypothetical protein
MLKYRPIDVSVEPSGYAGNNITYVYVKPRRVRMAVMLWSFLGLGSPNEGCEGTHNSLN